MTVSSLWKALDEAGCGRPVGVQEMKRPNHQVRTKSNTINPWNIRRASHTRDSSPSLEKSPAYAIDLSIWICEALTSSTMSIHHANPVLHLVFTRTARLLSMGIKLICVLEGKRRVRESDELSDGLRKRRNGTAFWRACQVCEEMLRLMGVPVLRAQAEGEALCALLNRRGVVDGVISNDGDCLLFGAKTVYTKFSLDNMDRCKVMRYDADNLRCILNAGNEEDDENHRKSKVASMRDNSQGTDSTTTTIQLNRNDLIAFALLTGSDLAGDGLPNVGWHKAVRFINKCKYDSPMRPEDACIVELRSWAVVAERRSWINEWSNTDQEALFCKPVAAGKTAKKCSSCNHPGDCRTHKKEGCKVCGTEPGEECLKVTQDDRFRKSLRDKAFAMIPRFDPAFVIHAYSHPNDNQVPYALCGTTARSLRMKTPDIVKFWQSSLLVKGHNKKESKNYVLGMLCKLTARYQLLRCIRSVEEQKEGPSNDDPTHCEHVIPVGIERKIIKDGVRCLGVRWKLNNAAGTTEAQQQQPKKLEEHEFQTIEAHADFQRSYPRLVSDFEAGKLATKTKQGMKEQQRRREFIESLFGKSDNPLGRSPPKKKSTRDARPKSTDRQEGEDQRHDEEQGQGKETSPEAADASKSGAERMAVGTELPRTDAVPKTIFVKPAAESRPPKPKTQFEYSEDIKKIMRDVLYATNADDNTSIASIGSRGEDLDRERRDDELTKQPKEHEHEHGNLSSSVDFFLRPASRRDRDGTHDRRHQRQRQLQSQRRVSFGLSHDRRDAPDRSECSFSPSQRQRVALSKQSRFNEATATNRGTAQERQVHMMLQRTVRSQCYGESRQDLNHRAREGECKVMNQDDARDCTVPRSKALSPPELVSEQYFNLPPPETQLLDEDAARLVASSGNHYRTCHYGRNMSRSQEGFEESKQSTRYFSKNECREQDAKQPDRFHELLQSNAVPVHQGRLQAPHAFECEVESTIMPKKIDFLSLEEDVGTKCGRMKCMEEEKIDSIATRTHGSFGYSCKRPGRTSTSRFWDQGDETHWHSQREDWRAIPPLAPTGNHRDANIKLARDGGETAETRMSQCVNYEKMFALPPSVPHEGGAF